MQVTKDIINVGVNDHDIDLFEGQFVVPNGMAYNSYVIMDEKIAVMDSVGYEFADQWIENVKKATEGRQPDYLVIQHMEPDHSANMVDFLNEFPDAKIVSSKKAFGMMAQFFGSDFAEKQIVVKEGDTLELGTHTLNFINAPMVHWPEVIMTYESTDKVLFSADGFGKFGATDADEDWACEARRYYFGIVGKYGKQVQAVLKKAAALDISIICPLHGPVLNEDLGYYIGLYDTWSSYRAETEGVFIPYTSVYGNTKKAVLLLAEKLEAKGIKVSVMDLAREDWAEAIEDAFRYDRIVFATTTYNNDIFPFMKSLIDHLIVRDYQNKKVGIIENSTWAPAVEKGVKKMLEGSKDITFCDNVVSIKSAMDDENIAQIEKLAEELAQ
ncbi:MAG: FprA family A-type flavoprotein [Anaerovoracaceae bacterium]|nr:FprA family A-type flavoprotein [Anaerovoracaceae bacterium]